MTLSAPPERQLMLDAVAQFSARSLGHLRDRPQQLPDKHDWQAILSAAAEAGLIATETEIGYLWQHDNPHAAMMSCDLLALIAGYHAGAAFCLHRLALGARIASRLQFKAAAAVFPWLPGGHQIAHASFPALLAGQASESGLFPEPGASVIWQAAPVDHQVLLPWSSGQSLNWALVGSDDWQSITTTATHGFDGLYTCSAFVPEVMGREASMVPDALAELLCVDALGLMAIALGRLARASQQAGEQATLRRQGGKAICEHPAVQLMLADIHIALSTGEKLLAASIPASLDAQGYRMLCASRVIMHESMCRAANSAMQIFGGMGYMRELGLESILRDHNQLRITAGAPDDLRLFVARGVTAP